MRNLLIKFVVSLSVLFSINAYAYVGGSFYYANESLNAFGVVIAAVDRVPKGAANDNDARTMLAKHMRNLVRQRSAVRDAQIIFDRFKENKDETIKQSAMLMSASLLMLGMTIDNTIELIEKMLNMSDKEVVANIGTFTKKTAELAEAMNKNWELYAKTSVSVTYTLIDGMSNIKNANPNIKLNKLNITKSQLNELKATIRIKFSSQVNQKDKNKLSYVDMPPIFLLGFLNGNWKTNNELTRE